MGWVYKINRNHLFSQTLLTMYASVGMKHNILKEGVRVNSQYSNKHQKIFYHFFV